MKKFKRILAITMTLAMVLTMGIGLTASAAGDGEITITPANNILKLDAPTFAAFKLFDASATGDGGYYYSNMNTAYNAFDGYPTSATDTLLEYIQSLLDPGDGSVLDWDAVYDLARAIWNWSDEEGLTPIPGTESGNNVVFDNLEYGYYIIAGAGIPNGTDRDSERVISFAMLNTVTDGIGMTIEIKADVPSIEKEVLNQHSADYEKWTDVGITETAQFRIVSTVPNTLGYEEYTYIVNDKLSSGLTFDSIVSVTAKDTAAGPDVTLTKDAAVNGYTFDGPEAITTGTYAGFNALTFTINSETILSLADTYIIEIIYEAVLNENAVIGDTGNPNWVSLKYSNNPNFDGSGTKPTGDTPEDDAWVYTYKLDIFKFTGTSTALEGVQFQLWNADNTMVAEFVLDTDIYRFNGFVTPPPGDVNDTLLITDSSGNINIEGIGEGDYILVEYQGLPGYNPIDDLQVYVYNSNIWEDDGTGVLVLKGSATDGIEWLTANRGNTGSGASLVAYSDLVDQTKVSVENNTGAVFPRTGGIGRTIFIVVGLTIMVGAVVALTVRRKVAKAVR